MAFIQYEGEYPEIENVPELIMIGSPPTPSLLYTQQDGDYPKLNTPEYINFNKPLPSMLYAQENSYPYLNTPQMYELFTKPVPFLFRTENKAKKTVHKVIVQKTKPQTIISNQRKNMMIATGTIKTELKELSQGGSVDLSVRPIVKGSVLNSVGWNVPTDELATVYSSTYTSQDFGEEGHDIYAINVTPILANGTVLSPSQLESAVRDIIVNGKDVYHIQMGDKFYGETISDAINKAETAAIRIHELHEECISKQSVYSNQENFKTYTIISMIDGVIT